MKGLRVQARVHVAAQVTIVGVAFVQMFEALCQKVLKINFKLFIERQQSDCICRKFGILAKALKSLAIF